MMDGKLRRTRRLRSLLPLLALLLAPLGHGLDLPNASFNRLMPRVRGGGVSYPVIHDLIQDRQGFIWVAALNIVARYDGDSFLFFGREDDPGHLSGDMLFCVFEDSRGGIWVSSNSGLYLLQKQTGRFLRFRNDPSDPGSLSSDRTRAICEDGSGALWIGTVGGGVNRMDPVTRRFTRFLHDPSDPDSPGGDDILSLCAAADGGIWMGAVGAGLDRYDPETGSWSHFPLTPGDPDAPGDRYLSLREGKDGTIWFGSSRSGLFGLDSSAGRYFRVDLGGEESRWRDYRVFSVLEDRDGMIWIGTENAGLFFLDPKDRTLARRTASPDPASNGTGGLSHDQVMTIIEDREGLLWFGTANGISVLHKRRSRFPGTRPGPGEGPAPASGAVISAYEDKDGVLWIGADKGGLGTWERRTGRWTGAPLDPGSSDRMRTVRVQAITEDDRGDLWFGTPAGLYRYIRRTGLLVRYLDPARDPAALPLSSITALHAGRPGFLWVGSQEGGFFEWDIDAGRPRLFPDALGRALSSFWINVVLVDRHGEVWIGTQWRGIIRFDPGTGRVSKYGYRSDDPLSLPNATVLSVAEDEDGRIWAGTEAGLSLYDAGRDAWTRPAEDLGLPNRPIQSIVPDGSGNLWMGSLENLIKVHYGSRLKRTYGAEDGLRSGRFSPGVGLRCRDEDIVFGGSSGIDRFRPGEIRDDPFLPPVAVSSVDLSSPPKTVPVLDEPDEIAVPRSRFPLVVRISALSFTRPERQRFRARQTSPEVRVFELGTERELRLDLLKPGRNRFVLYASNHDEVWNPEGRDLTIRVTVPFWKSFPWQLGLTVLVAASFWLWLRRRRRFLKQQLLHQIEGDLGPLSKHFDLTKREQIIVALILQGKSNKDIGAELFISHKTVKNHLYNIYQKMGVKSRLELANVVREFALTRRPPAT